MQLSILKRMSNYYDRLQSADPNCCRRRGSVQPEIVAIENTGLAVMFLLLSWCMTFMDYHSSAAVFRLFTLYMGISTIGYICLMITYSSPRHLNVSPDDTSSESPSSPRSISDEETDTDDDMPPLVPLDYNEDMPPLVPLNQNEIRMLRSHTNNGVLKQLQQVIDETNNRNNMRLTRSAAAAAAAAAEAAEGRATH